MIAGGVLGAIIAWATSLAILNIPMGDVLGGPVWAAIAVGIGVAVAVLAARINMFATVPATVFGIATSFGYLLQTPNMMTTEMLTSASLQNSVVLISLSAVFGGIYGLISAKIAGALASNS